MFIFQKTSSNFKEFYFTFFCFSFPHLKKFPLSFIKFKFFIPFFFKKELQNLTSFFLILYFFSFSSLPSFKLLKKHTAFFTGQTHFQILLFKEYNQPKDVFYFLDFLFFFLFFNFKTFEKFRLVFFVKKEFITFYFINNENFPLSQEFKFSTTILKRVFFRKSYFKFIFKFSSLEFCNIFLNLLLQVTTSFHFFET